MLQPTHYLALMACVPMGRDIQLHPDAISRLREDPAAYGQGSVTVYPVALTGDPDDMPPGFNLVYAGMGLPDGLAAARVPA
jgi:hypothetical protein